MRVIITTDDIDIQKLDRLVKRRNRKFFTRAVALREAITDYIQKHSSEIAWDEERLKEAEAQAIENIRRRNMKPHEKAMEADRLAKAAKGETTQVHYKVAPTMGVTQKLKICDKCEAEYCKVDGKRGACCDNGVVENKYLRCLCPHCWPERAGEVATHDNPPAHITWLREQLAERVKGYEAMDPTV